MKIPKWPVLLAVFLVGCALLAASLRNRSFFTRSRPAFSGADDDARPGTRSSPDSRSHASSADESPTTTKTETTVYTEAQARPVFAKPGVTAEEKRAALRAVARGGGAGARRVLSERLRDATEDATVRIAALTLLPAVAKQEGAEAVGETIDLLQELLGDRTFAADYLVMKALGDLGDARAVPILTSELVSDPDASTRIQAARALGPFATSGDVASALQNAALSDPSENVRLAAFGALLTATGESSRDFAKTVSELSSAPERLRALAAQWLLKLPAD